MTIFNLGQFPNVCRLCFQPNMKLENMVPLSQEDDVLACSIYKFIEMFTFEIAKYKAHLFPTKVCLPCLDLLRFYAKYRSKVLLSHRLMDGLAELRLSNAEPIEELFEQQAEKMTELIDELDLCNKRNASVKDLLDEFPLYEIALYPENIECEFSCDLETIDQNVVEEEMNDDALWLEPGVLEEDIKEEKLSEEPEESDNELGKQLPDPLGEPVNLEEGSDGELGDQLASSPAKRKRQKTSKKLSKPSVERDKTKKQPEVSSCPHCPYTTRAKRWFYEHMRTVHSDPRPVSNSVSKSQIVKKFVCELCGAQFRFSARLAQHMERHSNKQEYVCTYCQKGFNVERDLRQHIKSRHDATTIYKCHVCGLEFHSSVSRKHHMRTHLTEYKFPCLQCEKKFKTNFELTRHNKVHLPASYACPHCSVACKIHAKLMDHIESIHKIQMRFTCDICIKRFQSKDELDVHEKIHSNPGKLQCGICLKVYASDDQMADHLCITYRDDYICCGRDLRNHFQYNKHMFQKHGQKTNVRVKPPPGLLFGELTAQRKRIESCPKCEAIFPTRNQKKHHMESCVGPVATNANELNPIAMEQ